MIVKILFVIYILVRLTNAECFMEHNSENCQKSRSLYDFGPAAGDESLPRLDDTYVFIQTRGNFKFYDNYYSAFFLSTNGFIELKKFFEPFKMHVKFNFDSAKFPSADHAIIAPFWADSIPEENGQVFYRVTADDDTLAQISYDVNFHKKSEKFFLPTWASIITWYQLKAASHRRSHYHNTFQLVLTTDGEASYVMFNYGGLEWPNKRVNVNVSVGYNLGDNKSFFELEKSPAVDPLNLQSKSNVGMKSRWMFRVDNHQHQHAKNESIKRDESAKKEDTLMFHLIFFFVILIGMISIFNTAMWVRDFLKERMYFSELRMVYKKQVDEHNSDSIQNI